MKVIRSIGPPRIIHDDEAFTGEPHDWLSEARRLTGHDALTGRPLSELEQQEQARLAQLRAEAKAREERAKADPEQDKPKKRRPRFWERW